MSQAPRPAPEAVRAALEEDLAELYEDAPSGYLSTLPDGTIVKANGTFLRWTGFAREALVQRRRFQDLFATPGRVYYETHLGPLLAMQGTLAEIAVDIVRADGATLPVMLNAAQLKDDGGAPVVVRYTVFNATERRRYEKELLQARRRADALARSKTELLAMLSHDIRSPLGALMAVTHVLERGALTPEQQPMVRILRSSSTKMLNLVNAVLEHSRLEAGAVGLNPAPFDFGALVRELVADQQPLARDRGLALTAEVDSQLPAIVVGDATKLGQVLGNLVGNALKFTERGGVRVEVEVTNLSAAQVKLRVRVADTGIGIGADELPRIFGEYTQAHNGIARRYGGAGLGLAISGNLLRAHGSKLDVDSTPGKGSVFSFELELPLR